MKQTAFAYSFQGAGHIKKEADLENFGKKFPCQDRAFSGNFEPSQMIEKKDISLFVKNNSSFVSHVMLPVEMCPHKAGFSLICVADGHGSAPHFRSEKGAELSIQTAIELLSESIDKIDAELQKKNYSKINKNLSKSFVRRWMYKILEDIGNTKKEDLSEQINELKKSDYEAAEKYEKDLEKGKKLADHYLGLCQNLSVENEEKSEINTILDDFCTLSLKSIYGCTTVVYFQLKNSLKWYAFKIGDSDLFASFDGVFVKPIKDDPKCFLNTTTSLCDDNADKEFCFPEIEYLEKIPDSVFCSTDGVADSFQDESFIKKFYDQLQFMYNEDGDLKTENEIKEYLPKLSEKGSGDDISLAGIISYDDSIEAKQIRRQLAENTVGQHWKKNNYSAIYPILKPYLDKGESRFKYINAVYDFGEMLRLSKLNFNQNFIVQWDKAYLNLTDIKNEITLMNCSDKLNRYISQLYITMEAIIEKDINNSINTINQKYIDELFSPFITSELNRYYYYKVLYEYRWLKKCFTIGMMTSFYDYFRNIENDMIVIARNHNFKDIDNAQKLMEKYLSDLHNMMSRYWSMQGPIQM
ncbi:protein phosphatase 2C domain-containing protein [Treponema sp. OMZ 788]|uniref:protein phosphatase 2C domain-containing protein n=1 Tax=Treponema sp. OMZ 788 TaxID=2563664 RepID=UPI0020A50A6F|nr:protein phosphatase 2C domain-containing protein [Treponema sp. OMZ 788]UTC64527.1 protein phosphatase 2C domain-containing protein [Treponema sp. OMZ 788]